jgi:hypothetical protein
VEVDWLSLSLLQLCLCQPFVVFNFVFDDYDLQRFADLGSSETYSWRIPHGVPHMLDQALYLIGGDLGWC